MRSLILTSTVVCALGLASVGPALAGSCPKLVAQINDVAGKRFDKSAAEARMKAKQAEQLHKDGKHAESEKLAKEALDLLGIKS